MSLHRSEAMPDWERVAPYELNQWQSVAAKTGGIITPGNFLSLLGFWVVCYGLFAVTQEQFWTGFVAVTIGRMADLLDGKVADMTGTKSPIGEAVDASIDKLATGLILLVLLTTGIINPAVLAAVFLPHLVIAVIAIINLSRKKRLHPSRLGKISMALAWAGLIGVILANAVSVRYENLVATSSHVVIYVSIGLGVLAGLRYFRKHRD